MFKIHCNALIIYLSNIRQTKWEIGQVACVAQNLCHHMLVTKDSAKTLTQNTELKSDLDFVYQHEKG